MIELFILIPILVLAACFWAVVGCVFLSVLESVVPDRTVTCITNHTPFESGYPAYLSNDASLAGHRQRMLDIEKENQ
jgi:hypothetical protein